jgi:hypothetical protein
MSVGDAQILLQSISALAAAGSLIYLVLEFRGWRTAQYVANFTKLVELQLQLRRLRFDDPTLISADTEPTLSALPAEKVRTYFYYLMQLSLFEVAWFSHSQKQIPDDYFASWVNNMRALAQLPGFQLMWATETTKIMHDGFRHYMDGLMAEVKSPTVATTDSRPLSLN